MPATAPNPLSVACTFCGAHEGSRCVGLVPGTRGDYRPIEAPHSERVALAHRISEEMLLSALTELLRLARLHAESCDEDECPVPKALFDAQVAVDFANGKL